MVFSRNIKQIVKKKYSVTPSDKKDWFDFTKNMGKINIKEEDFARSVNNKNKLKKLDLHGYSLDEANELVKKFIVQSYNDGYKKILIVTGKGLRSKSIDDPYTSKKFGILRYSIPEYIRSNEILNSKISEISEADLKNGGEGAIYIILKSIKKIKE